MPDARVPSSSRARRASDGAVRAPSGPVAVIDLGASAVRLVVAQIEPGRPPVVLEEASRGLQLGRDTFSSGRIGPSTMDAAVRAFAGFRSIMDGYGVVACRAVATSAVREAANADIFLDRVRVRTGITIDVIDGSEESRFTYLATRERLRNHPVAEAEHALLLEVGGGSADLTRLERMQPTQSGVYPIGAIRLRQMLASWHGPHEQRIRLLTRHIANVVYDVAQELRLAEATDVIALGSDIRFAAARLVEPVDGFRTVARDQLVSFVTEVERLDEEDLVERFRLPQVDAETLVPAMLVYRELLLSTSAAKVVVPDVSLRDGMLVDLAASGQDQSQADFERQVLASAQTMGEKYRYDAEHAQTVRRLAGQIFDQLKTEHSLGPRDRLLLDVAAILHDIGLFVGLRGHHKHSQYILEAAEIFGLSREDMKVIANIARYHRRGAPQKTHLQYVSLSREDRVRVNKLGAILRLANALDAEHLQKVQEVKMRPQGETLLLALEGTGDLTMERLVAVSRADMLTEVFGRRVVIAGAGVES